MSTTSKSRRRCRFANAAMFAFLTFAQISNVCFVQLLVDVFECRMWRGGGGGAAKKFVCFAL